MTLKDFFPKPSVDNDGDRKKPNKIIIFVIISAVVLLAASSFFDFKSNPGGKSAAVSDDFDAAGKKAQAHNVHFVYFEQGVIQGNLGIIGSVVFFYKDISHKKGSVDKTEIVDDYRMIFVIKMCTFLTAALRRIGQAVGIAEGKHLLFIVFVNIGEGYSQGRGC